MSLLTMFDSLCTIRRPKIGQDAQAGTTQDPFENVAVDLPCSYQESSASVLDIYGQRNTVVSNTVYLAQDPNTEVNDQVLVTLADGSIVYLLCEGEATPVARFVLWQIACQRVRAPQEPQAVA